MEEIKKQFEVITGESYDDMMTLDLPMDLGKVRRHFSGVHKYWLYNDPFLGIFDTTLRDGVKEQYVDMTDKLNAIASKQSKFSYLYESSAALTKLLSLKYDLGVRTREAYKANDKDALTKLTCDYADVIAALESFIVKFRARWYHDNKPHGFDVQELRLGGLLLRLRSQRDRLIEYVNGSIDGIPELEEEILPYNGILPADETSDLPTPHGWFRTATVNHM
jgi:hypothetical protein